MIYDSDRIARDVRIAMDRNTMSAPLLEAGDVDTLSVDEVILSVIEDAVRRVHSEAPVHLLEGGHDFSRGGVFWDGEGAGHVILPDDFMRLVSFMMSDWTVPVFSAISTDDAEYEKQHSRWKGLRGVPERPVAAIAVRPEGRVLEFWSCRDRGAGISRAQYVPYPETDGAGRIDISPKCYTAVVYTAASLALATFGDTNGSSAMLELAKGSLV